MCWSSKCLVYELQLDLCWSQRQGVTLLVLSHVPWQMVQNPNVDPFMTLFLGSVQELQAQFGLEESYSVAWSSCVHGVIGTSASV